MITGPKPWLSDCSQGRPGSSQLLSMEAFLHSYYGAFFSWKYSTVPRTNLLDVLIFCLISIFAEVSRMLLQHSNSDFWLIMNYSHPLVVPHGFQDKTLVPVHDVWGFWWPCPAWASLISYGPALPAASHAQYPGMCVCPALSWLRCLFLLSEWNALPPCLFQVNLVCFFHLQESFNPLFKCLSAPWAYLCPRPPHIQLILSIRYEPAAVSGVRGTAVTHADESPPGSTGLSSGTSYRNIACD